MYYPGEVKHHKTAITLNLVAAMVNIVIWINSIYHGGWIGWLNCGAAMVGVHFARESYHRFKEAQREEQEYVIEVLSGKIG